jgi:coenzyme F420-dependent glucose-6-phosphate dehydrogenase
VIGGIAQVTSRLIIGTGVTCPIFRIHPAIIAQAAATAATMLPGRFFLGVGSGENLNEHILGDRWPEVEVRQERLVEAIRIIRMLWQEGQHSHSGKYFTIENARIYSRPDQPPRLMVAAAGPKSARLAAQFGDGLIPTDNCEIVQKFQEGAGNTNELVSAEEVAKLIPCGPDPEKHVIAIRQYIDAGLDHIFIHQIGPNQSSWIFTCEKFLPT